VRFKGEAELLTRLNHPNIVKFYGYVKSRHFLVPLSLSLFRHSVEPVADRHHHCACVFVTGHQYFILEYLEEGSLSKVLSDFGVIPEKLAAFYIDQARPTYLVCVSCVRALIK
jgi:serine/threonine protein kinase